MSKSKCQATSTVDANIPPRNSCQEEYLFLLEFYVREIQSSRLAKLNEMFFVPTTVAFCFLDFNMDDGLQLTPVDPLFEPQAGIADDVESFHNGRSVLFALSREGLTNMHSEFKINMSVVKKMPADIKPDVLVGKAQIDMTPHFAALRKETIDMAKYGDSAIPCLDDENVALVFGGCLVGSLSVFARVSVHGQTIVTEFESPSDDPSTASAFLFRADDRDCEGKPLGYKCRVLDPEKCDLSSLLSEDGSKDECAVCQPPKLPCAPCRVGSGARVTSEGCSAPSQPRPAPECQPKTACRPIQTSRGPREPCGKAVVLKVSGLIDFCEDPTGKKQPARVTVAGEDEAATPADLSDPDHDVFVLRIGKKGLVGAAEKSDIQLEMRTPKGPDKRPPVRLETREMQTEEGSEGKGGKAPKGKKKK
ncbi:uncharacterized protein LOC106640823 [Copidosoma floridanum]|uniref:uncharacterized protein LOC106640823 n=1 Tax=Copidosoma floridanum TaxID=29053 RepID=UPI000C6F7AD7|nr:uncharacterized protein LOC106640823 [Copidosoma floridanum]